jgi:hypothetical protein
MYLKSDALLRKIIQSDSKLLSGCPFIDHGNPDNNLESPCTSDYFVETFRSASTFLLTFVFLSAEVDLI